MINEPEEQVIVEDDRINDMVRPPVAVILGAVVGKATVPPKVKFRAEAVTEALVKAKVLPAAAVKYNLGVGTYLATIDRSWI